MQTCAAHTCYKVICPSKFPAEARVVHLLAAALMSRAAAAAATTICAMHVCACLCLCLCMCVVFVFAALHFGIDGKSISLLRAAYVERAKRFTMNDRFCDHISMNIHE